MVFVSQNSPETFLSQVYFGTFLAHSFSKTVSQKARKCSELSSSILGFCSMNSARKVILEHSFVIIIFFQASD